jgi:imidazolonepropionase-like amidohydrolase
MFGVSDQLGTIEVGKRANLLVVEGDPLEIRSAVRHLVINGNEVDLSDKHSKLYERYRSRPTTSR